MGGSGRKQAVGRISSDPILDALQPSVFPSVIPCGMDGFLRSLHIEDPIKQGVLLAGGRPQTVVTTEHKPFLHEDLR